MSSSENFVTCNKNTDIQEGQEISSELLEDNDPLSTGNIATNVEQLESNVSNVKTNTRFKNVCPKCGKAYRFKTSLQLHIKNDCDTFYCIECPKIFNTNYSLKLHSVSHLKTKDYKCTECDKRFATEKYLRDHMLTHNECRPYECDKCSATFTLKKVLTRHVLNHSKSIFCSECNKELSNDKCLRQHQLNYHNGERAFECEVCNKKFSNASGLKRHSVSHKSKQYKCNICYQLFTYKSTLIDHYNIHTKEKKYECLTCGKSYAQPRGLREHALSHSSEKQRCIPCSRNFKNFELYEKHLVMHRQGMFSFSCKICNVNFACRSSFNRHNQMHKSTFRCGECEKVFHTKEYLKNHMMIHLDLRPISCTHCSKKFRQKSHFMKHVKSVHKYDANNIKTEINSMENGRKDANIEKEEVNINVGSEIQVLYKFKTEPELDLDY